MPGQTAQNQAQSQSSVSAPWAPAQPLLQSLINQYSGLSTGVTPGQTTAANNLTASASDIPNFGSDGAAGLAKLFNSSTTPQVGMLNSGLANLNTNIGAAANPANNNPFNTPGFSESLSALTNNITNSVKGVYAGSGRDPSGAGSFAKSLGIGLLQGEAPVLQSQYNANVANQQDAAKTLYNATGNTAGQITGQQQVPLTNAGTALNLIPSLTGAYTSPAAAQLGAATTSYNLPYGNLQSLLGPAAQIGGLGGQTSGSSTGTVSQNQNPLSNILGGVTGGLGLLSFLSDEDAKTDIEKVGKLDDGQKVYSYRYKGDPRTQIGLLAQEVQKRKPAAVSRHPGMGMLMVDYHQATRGAVAAGKKAA